METEELGLHRRTEDAGGAIRLAVLQNRLDPEAATRWLLGLSKVALERQARFADALPRRRATDP
jgi:hypothetical protein